MIEHDYYLNRDVVTLKAGPDPAVERVRGHHRFHIGLDLGQNDPSAVVIIEDRQFPVWSESGRQILGERSRSVVYADRITDTRYPALAYHVQSLMQRGPLKDRCSLTIDATGGGRVFGEVLSEWNIDHTRVQMTGGMVATKKGLYHNVSKTLLITDLATAIENRHLTIAADLPLRTDFIRELESVQVKITAAGNQVLDAGSSDHHADMMVACALAYYRSDLFRGFVGEGRLEGWY